MNYSTENKKDSPQQIQSGFDVKKQAKHSKKGKGMKPKKDIYQTVTDTIINAIENGANGKEWSLPWHGVSALPQNANTSKQYRGVNVPMLWAAQMGAGYKGAQWATYKQWAELGAQVRKGEKSTSIVFWKIIPNAADEDGKPRMFARWSSVFNVDQVDGYEAAPDYEPAQIDPQEAAERLIMATGAKINHGNHGAAYYPAADLVKMPERESFKDTEHSSASENYYSTMFHELTHWSGAPHRLERTKGKKFGDAAYAFEELIAELGAAFLCATTGTESAPREDHAQYIASWLKALKGDNAFIFSAASAAQKAADYIQTFDTEEQSEAA